MSMIICRVLSGFWLAVTLLGMAMLYPDFGPLMIVYLVVLIVGLIAAMLVPSSIYRSDSARYFVTLYSAVIVMSILMMVQDLVWDWGPDYGALVARGLIALLFAYLIRRIMQGRTA